MVDILEFIKQFLYEIIFTFLLSSGFFALYLKKFKNKIDTHNLGITRIHKLGKSPKQMIKAIEGARKIMQLSFVPHNFIFDTRPLIEKKIDDGCSFQFLFCNYNSTMLKEASQMENNTDNDISLKIEPTINMLKVIKQRSNPESNGSIEVRSYNTEIRNPVTICIDVDGKANAFLTVLVPPKRSIDCIMLEYEGDQCIDVLKYFNLIWDRHKTDVLLDTKKP